MKYMIISILICLIACGESEDSNPDQLLCDQKVIVDGDLYQSDTSDFISIIAAEITDDCLSITYSASGCSGDSWQVKLYDSGAVAESEPEQRYIRLSLENPEACLAVFTQEMTFDVRDLQIENNGTLILNLEGYESSFTYNY